MKLHQHTSASIKPRHCANSQCSILQHTRSNTISTLISLISTAGQSSFRSSTTIQRNRCFQPLQHTANMHAVIAPVALLGLASMVSALRIPRQFGQFLAATNATATNTTSGQASSTFPEAAGYSQLSEPMSVTGAFDGKMFRFDRGGKHLVTACKGDTDDSSFVLWPE